MSEHNRTQRVTVRLSAQEALALRLMAEAARMHRAEYVRARLLDAPVGVQRLAAIQGELRRLGGLQKHLVQQRSWTPAERDQFRAAIDALTRAESAVREALADAG
jgi:hypothetical protein